MNRNWFSILLVTALLALLGALAYLQYSWLGEISDAQRERLRARLESDTKRFAEDFNRELLSVYQEFQIASPVWEKRDWNEFNKRYDGWLSKTEYPGLVKDICLHEIAQPDTISCYDKVSREFLPAAWTVETTKLRDAVSGNKFTSPVQEEIPALALRIHEQSRETTPIVVKGGKTPEISLPPAFGYLFVILDRDVISAKLLPALAARYFSDTEGANFSLTVTQKKDTAEIIYQSHPARAVTSAEISVPLFDITPNRMSLFVGKEMLSKARQSLPKGALVFNQKLETRSSIIRQESVGNKAIVDLKVIGDAKPSANGVSIFEQSFTSDHLEESKWTLEAQHRDGSLEEFISNTRRKNLGVSFSILALLAGATALIFVSARRAQNLAQKQLDFVSAVSHEFRTPLAVIYSAGENLTDGIVKQPAQVSQYGDLIKSEGKKLSGMVEQILEFAGVRSGNRQYDLRSTNVESVIGAAIAECNPLANEKGFTIEQGIAKGLPPIFADQSALSHALQNLIINAIKYSDGEKWMKVSAANGNREVKITVEDKGIGIAPNEIGRIFTPFYRGRDVVFAQIHGNGLGLSLVKQVVEAHGGRIEVESKLGEGSKFTITLPVKE